MSLNNKAIDNKVVLVTRPAAQAVNFIQLLNDNGFNARAFPCIDIQAIEITEALRKTLSSLQTFELIIFISANAVQHAVRVLTACNIEPASVAVEIATIGKATLNAAIESGFKVSTSPDQGYNSDALLAQNALQRSEIKNKRCLIFRGEGGLDHLADELRLRGAKVRYAEVYRRCKPQRDDSLSRSDLSRNWGQFNISAITVTSNESLQNLYDMIAEPGRHYLLKTTLVVASQRGVELAQSLGFKIIKCARSAINQHMLQALKIELK